MLRRRQFIFGAVTTTLIFTCVIACKANKVVSLRTAPCKPFSNNLALVNVTDYLHDAAPIINNKCAVCHGQTGGKQPDLNSYANLKNNYAAAIAAVVAGRMPPTGLKLTSTEITTLQNWAASNFVEDRAVSTSPTTTYTYANHIQSFLNTKCLHCHNIGGQSPDLSSYTQVQLQAANINRVINAGTMPPSGGITTTEKTMINDWVNAGAPNTASDIAPTNTNNYSDATANDTGC